MSNLIVRVIVAIVGIPCLLWITWSGGYPLWAMILLLQILMLYEWMGILAKCGIEFSILKSIVLIAALYSAILFDSQATSLAFLLVIIWLLSFLLRQRANRIASMGGGILYLFYIAIPLVLWISISKEYDPARFSASGALVLLFVSTWFCDSGAYFVGRSLGRHKLLERVSPNKTIEGAIGGVVFSALPLLIIKFFGWGNPLPFDYAALPITVGLFGQAGDLLESQFKREAGIKDSSQLIPGHGGILDRFDSLLISTPVFYAYLKLFA